MPPRPGRNARWPQLALAGGLIALLAGCAGSGGSLNLVAQGASGNPSQNAAAASSHPSARSHTTTHRPTHPPSSHATAGPDGTWTGSYVCAQGATGLDLTIAGSTSHLAAVFHFHPLPSNPSAADGIYTMTGSASGRTVTLHQQSWVSQPPGYLMVDLSGALSPDGGTLSGTVIGEGCSTFSVQRT